MNVTLAEFLKRITNKKIYVGLNSTNKPHISTVYYTIDAPLHKLIQHGERTYIRIEETNNIVSMNLGLDYSAYFIAHG